MELKEIKELIQLMGKVDLTEVALEKDDFKLTLKRELATGQVVTQVVPAPVQAPVAAAAPAETAATVQAEDKDIHYVTAPLVGTFYASPSPEAGSFIKVGDRVKKGQTLCIVEAMKLMNEIESDADGVIVEILCENATPVEYGTKIIAINTKK